MNRARYIRWFEEISHRDVPLVGGKNAALGELYRALRPLGVPVPNGFAITAEAYRAALKAKGAWERLEKLLSRLDPDDYEALARTAARAREIVYEAGLPEDVRDEILAAYAALSRSYGEEDLA
ncbi:MAG: phosphoenolpyruvate synthase, partial [Zetaproteobacteria bacterium]